MGSVLLAFVLLAGCVQPEATPSPSPLPSPTIAASPSPIPSPSPSPSLAPVELEYEVSGFFSNDPQQKATMTYWFEEEADCSGKKALNGIYSVSGSQMGGGTVWGKTTYYYESGELASTDLSQKSGLMFEASRVIQAPIIINFLQELFASAGKDFASSEVWDSTKPLVIKDVNFFSGSKQNVSVVNKGAGSGATPCTDFALYSTNSPGAIIACATKPTEAAPYSITVYIKPGDDWPANAGNFPTWKLVRVPAKEASGESALLECVDFVRCKHVESPSQSERDACEAGGDKKMRDEYDANQCVSAYACKTVNDIAVEQVQQMQGPSCGMPSQSVMDAVANCIREDRGGINWSNDQNGCVISASC
ncbi:hypothetical protein COU39_03405 [Candidatus Micrarchaeota archaeon CG10_big_fil_rev_8_21_14_0_10_60_32]|nr:MAG: hypothetical protein COU39_03405 [Candidatus Micrarchaeota archaeon CG10_big_fil_rev_8_21_14_0_10_60_32]